MKRESKVIFLITAIIILGFIWWYVPKFQVNIFEIGINNSERATLENQYRVTLTQALGGIAILYGVYQGWKRIAIAEDDLKATQKNLEVLQGNLKIAQENLEVSREEQITERFTRAVDQLGAIDKFGNPAIEIRLGGIYALERIAKESRKDYLPIMEILTTYVRKNSPINEDVKQSTVNVEVSFDIQAILTVIGRRNHLFDDEKTNCLNLRKTLLQCADLEGANLKEANLEQTNLAGAVIIGANLERVELYMAFLESIDFRKANLKGASLSCANLFSSTFEEANLEGANLRGANLKETYFTESNLKNAELKEADLENAFLIYTNLEGANFYKANLKSATLEGANLMRANLIGADLKDADFKDANLTGANFYGAHLKGAINLTVDQLSKVKTLYKAELEDKLLIPLKEKFPALFDDPLPRQFSTIPPEEYNNNEAVPACMQERV